MYEDQIRDAIEVLERMGFHRERIRDLREAKTPYQQALALESFKLVASGAGNDTPSLLHKLCSDPCKYGGVQFGPLIALEALRTMGLAEILFAQLDVRFRGENGVVVVTVNDRFLATVPADKWKAALDAQTGSTKTVGKVTVTTSADGHITVTAPLGVSIGEMAAAVPGVVKKPEAPKIEIIKEGFNPKTPMTRKGVKW